MKTHQNFLKFNGKNIVFLKKDGTYYVAIKPICEALNVVYTGQLRRVKNDPIYGPALYKCTIQVPYFNENNQAVFQGRKMLCLPERYIYGWIMGINSDKKELIEYKKTCNDLLYEHFKGTITNRKELLYDLSIVEHEIDSLTKDLILNNSEFQKLEELKLEKKNISKSLKGLDKEVVSQYKMKFN